MITLTVTLTRQDGQVTTLMDATSIALGTLNDQQTMTVVNRPLAPGEVGHRVLLESLAAVDVALVAEPDR